MLTDGTRRVYPRTWKLQQLVHPRVVRRQRPLVVTRLLLQQPRQWPLLPLLPLPLPPRTNLRTCSSSRSNSNSSTNTTQPALPVSVLAARESASTRW